MFLLEWFTLVVGLFFTSVAVMAMTIPSIREEKPITFFMVLEIVFTLTATIVALQTIRTGG